MNLQQLREKLKQGFYVKNLYEMARLCKDLALESKSPAPFYVMQHIFSDIARYWEDKPVIVEEAKLVEVEVIKHIRSLIDAIETNAPGKQISKLLNNLVSSYLFLFR